MLRLKFLVASNDGRSVHRISFLFPSFLPRFFVLWYDDMRVCMECFEISFEKKPSEMKMTPKGIFVNEL